MSIAVIGVGIAARNATPEPSLACIQLDGPVKAGKPMVASSGASTVR